MEVLLHAVLYFCLKNTIQFIRFKKEVKIIGSDLIINKSDYQLGVGYLKL